MGNENAMIELRLYLDDLETKPHEEWKNLVLKINEKLRLEVNPLKNEYRLFVVSDQDETA